MGLIHIVKLLHCSLIILSIAGNMERLNFQKNNLVESRESNPGQLGDKRKRATSNAYGASYPTVLGSNSCIDFAFESELVRWYRPLGTDQWAYLK